VFKKSFYIKGFRLIVSDDLQEKSVLRLLLKALKQCLIFLQTENDYAADLKL
jgi:hypothetical protein